MMPLSNARPSLNVLPIFVAALAMAACKPQAAITTQPQPVQIMTVEGTSAAATRTYTGVVRARYETDQGFRVAGKIIARKVDVGQRVEAGQVVAELDPTDLKLALQSQEAEVMAARSNREQAVAAEDRFRKLFQQGYVAKAALEQRTATADEARSRAERSDRNLALARNQLAYAELKAEHTGTITALQMEIGQVVGVGQTVARIARLDTLDAVVAIPEQMLQAAQSSTAEVEIWGNSGSRVKAKLRELAPEADRLSRTYQARFALIAPGTQVQLGRTATVHLSGAGEAAIMQVPIAAVINDGRGAAVWRIEEGDKRAVRAPVTIASLTKDHALISSGLVNGNRIVTLGAHMLDETKPIRIVEQRAAVR
jgi:membrane fusion protein, multidrug efflux system